MAYDLVFALALGTGQAGLADLRARLYDDAGATVGAEVSAGFFEHGSGNYQWLGTIPDGHRGSVRFYRSGSVASPLAVAAINPEEFEVVTMLADAHGSGPWGAGAGGSVSWDYVVTDGTNPLEDAEVWVTAPNSSTVIESGRTDATGTYTFTLNPGTYWFYARLSGYSPNNPDVEVVA